MKNMNDFFDVAVIGGGPAGMMAAGRAAQLGARVILLEKNLRLGTKLLITGKGRCNVTNDITNRELADRLGKNGKFLLSGLNKFGPAELMSFLESRGLRLKTENNNRVFPVSDKSQDVLNIIERYLRDGKVTIKHGAEVIKFIQKENRIDKIILASGEEVVAKKYIFATGGKSYPLIGSTGDGYKWSKKLGHTITELHPALSPIVVKEVWIKNLEGAPLKEVELILKVNNKVIQRALGDGIVTANGLSGPVAHDLSKRIGVEQKLGHELEVLVDFFPGRDLDQEFVDDFNKLGQLMLRTYLARLVSPKIFAMVLAQSGIDPDIHLSSISKIERQKVASLLNGLTFNVKGVVGYDKAIVTAGGVALSEIDGKTMKSKLVDNLYFAGEILDLDGPTGGYNLQICWTSGFVAGEAAGLDK